MTKLKFSRRTAMATIGSASMIAIANATSSHAASSLQDFGSQLQTLPEITIYTAQRVITMEDKDPAINAVAVVGDRVLVAGSREEIVQRIGSQPYRLDERFAEKVIVAGLIDQHVHPFLAGLTLTSEIISIEDWNIPTGFSKAAKDEADFKSRLKAAEAAMDNPHALLLRWGYHHFFHGEIRRAQLDEISSTRPIIIVHRSAHELILNTPALELLGITQDFVNGFKGLALEQSSYDDGYFFEAGMFAVLPAVAPVLATPERLGAVSDVSANGTV